MERGPFRDMENSDQFYADLGRCELISAYIKRIESECDQNLLLAVRKEFSAKIIISSACSDETGPEVCHEDIEEPMPLTFQESVSTDERSIMKMQPDDDKLVINSLNPEGNLELQPSPALFNPSVLDVMFSYLDLENLKNCRLVCKEWDNEASNRISKIVRVLIPIPPTSPENQAKLAAFIHEIKLSRHFPISKYSLITVADCPLDQPALNEFFELFGHSVKDMEIFAFSSSNIRQLVQKIAQFCPNLGCLIVDGSFGSKLPKAEIPDAPMKPQMLKLKSVELLCNLDEDACMCLFEAAPNLTAIKMDWGEGYGNRPDPSIVVSALRASGRLPHVTDIWVDYMDTSTSHLLKSGTEMSLKKFGFRASDEIEVADLEIFLISQQKTLTSINLGDCEELVGNISPPRLVLSKMESLSDLTMQFTDQYFYVTSPTPAEDFPKLKRVNIEDVTLMCRIPDQGPCPSVTDLNVNLSAPRPSKSKSVIWCLGRFFPNVESLTLKHPDPDDIAVASQVWPNLKHFYLEVVKPDGDGVKQFNLEEIQQFFPKVLTFPGLKTFSVWGRMLYP